MESLEQEYVMVGGHVRFPGEAKLEMAPDLWSAIQWAGGVTEFADISEVCLTRGRFAHEYDMRNPEHQAIPLEHKDAILVPQKFTGPR